MQSGQRREHRMNSMIDITIASCTVLELLGPYYHSIASWLGSVGGNWGISFHNPTRCLVWFGENSYVVLF